ncbi:MAG: response regulator transcription factor [Clostridiales bacterium]|nr:response regulator transcription factor [Clostridiales bacterium]
MRLLLAEDERALSNALVTILKHNNYSVDAVYNGQDALEYLLSGNYDGAILDIMMPKMDGISVLKAFRAQNKNLPVLLLTAKTEIDDKVLGLDSGADDYLGKPFDTKELLARIRAMLRRKSGEAVNTLEFADIMLNRSAFELSSQGGSFRLGNKEFQMMEMLMLNAGKVISAERFMEKIWGYETDTEMTVVWTYISYLRKKLAALSDMVQIKAMRNIGYTLERIHD